MKGKKRVLKKDYRRWLFPLYFCNGEEKKAMPRKNATDFFFFFRKSVFCTWDIPIVPYIRYQNASFCANEMSRYASGTSA